MLQVGDTVVYPMHGAGVISGIEDCEVLGEGKSYYVLQMPLGNMKVMIPTDNVDNMGLRDVIPETQVEEVKDMWRLSREISSCRIACARFRAASGAFWISRGRSSSVSLFMPAANRPRKSSRGWMASSRKTILPDADDRREDPSDSRVISFDKAE